jgi:hypothetical protein
MPEIEFKSFLGMTVESLKIQDDVDLYFENMRCDSDRMFFPYRMRCHTITLKFELAMTDKQLYFLDKHIRGCNSRLSLSNLGPSIICNQCGYEIKSGTLVCHRCGSAIQKEIPGSRYYDVGNFLIYGFEYRSKARWTDYSYPGSPSWSDNTPMQALLVLRTYEGFTLYSGQNEWQTLHASGWICQYRNTVNQDKRVDCFKCGGGRLPFSDLFKLPSHCLYCGCELIGNSVCAACGDARNGYSVWPPFTRAN